MKSISKIFRAIFVGQLIVLFVFALVGSVAASTVKVDFENDPFVGSNITCNPAFLIFECNPAHHAYINAQGIDITGDPPGFLWSTIMSGTLGSTGVVIGYASPSFADPHDGLSGNEILTITFLQGPVKHVDVTLTTIPSPVINNIPSTVMLSAFDGSGNLITSSSVTFTGVTNNVLTPAHIVTSSPSSNIATVKLTIGSHPIRGVFIEELEYIPTGEEVKGRMTGGGSLFTSAGMRVTHSFELHCDAAQGPNNLQVNWGKGNKFHLENLTTASCSDDPTIAPNPPAAGFDTYKGEGTGRFNGVSGATAKWTFTDAGEPGGNDFAKIEIKVGTTTVLSVSGNLNSGNHQAHAQ